jgi:DNA primase
MGRYIPDDILDEVRLRSDIVEVIQTYLPLKRGGGRLKGLCPFHAEKTPSFIVNPDRQSYHCFGCGRGGDVFRFVMERENVDFPTAVELMAVRCGVEIPEESSRRGGGAGGGEAGEGEGPVGVKRPRLFQLHEDLAEWYADQLRGNPGSVIGRYAAGRGLDDATMAKFRLGASPDSWDETLNRCLRRGYTQEELLVAGIVIENEERKRVYDRFRSRLMFPIWDEQGRVVAFSARAVVAETEGAKYVNSPETPIFRKGRVLYALPLAREGFRRHGCAILCEGQLDVIAMHRAGFDNAVAPQGTAFTPEQAQALHRYTAKVLLAFDGDEAGAKAVFRALEILLPQDIEVGVIAFPAGADPDGLFAAGGHDAVATHIAAARDFFDVTCERAAQGIDAASPWGRRRIADAALRLVALIGNGVTRAGYCTRLAQRLAMPEDAIFAELNRLRRSPARPVSVQAAAEEGMPSSAPCEPAPELNPAQRAQAILLELSLAAGVYGKRLAADLSPTWVDETTPLGRALSQVVALTLAGKWEDAPRILAAGLAQAPDPVVSRILADPQFDVGEGQSVDSQDPLREKAYLDAMNLLARWHAQQEIDRLNRELRNAGGNAGEVLQQLMALKRRQIGLATAAAETAPIPAATPSATPATSPEPEVDLGLESPAPSPRMEDWQPDADTDPESAEHGQDEYDGEF